MAPALVSECAVNGRFERLSAFCFKKRITSMKNLASKKIASGITSSWFGRCRLPSAEFNIFRCVHDLTIIRERNTLKLSKKMNPNHGSSKQNNFVKSSPEHKQNSSMCGGTENVNTADCKSRADRQNDPESAESRNSELNAAADVAPTAALTSRHGVCGVRNSFDSELESLSYEKSMRRHSMLTRRAAKLESRIRRLQAKQAVARARSQVHGLVANQKQRVVLTECPDNSSTLDLKGAQNMSTSALVTLVQKWQSQQPHSRKASKQDANGMLTLDEEVCSELGQVSGHLQSNVKHLKHAFDPDATESSSGGESCDEGDFEFDDWSEKSKAALDQRVDWQWASDRCDVASRWTWLQAQVSDLEYRIRQQTEIHRQIRQKKGDVKLGEMAPPCGGGGSVSTAAIRDSSRLEMLHQSNMAPAAVSPIMSNIDKQSASLKNQLGNIYTPSPPGGVLSPANGVTTRDSESVTPNGILPSASFASRSLAASCSSASTVSSSSVSTPMSTNSSESLSTPSSSQDDVTCVAARCRPTILGKYRKRKLLRTANLHARSRKCARLSDVRCKCYPPVTPCAMCGGRYNNTRDIDAYGGNVSEKIALLDHSYHQVLSLNEEVALSVTFGGMLKSGQWQARMQTNNSGQFSIERKGGQYRIKQKRKLVKKTASLEVLSRIKSKYAVERMYSALPMSPDRRRMTRISSNFRIRKRKSALQGDAFRKKGRRSYTSYGSGGAGDSATMREIKDHVRRKRAESAYDINNIVIPYSVAASTRVEKLQYKEIVTPSWRVVERPPADRAASGGGAAGGDGLERCSSAAAAVAHAKDSCKEKLQEKMRRKSTTVIEAGCDACGPAEEGDEEIEDLSDETFRARHSRIEEEERRKYMTHVTPTSQQQQRRQRGGGGGGGGGGLSSSLVVGVMTPDPSSPEASVVAAQQPPPSQQQQQLPASLHASVSHNTLSSTHSSDLLADDGRFVLDSGATSARRRASSVSSTLSTSHGGERWRDVADMRSSSGALSQPLQQQSSSGWPRRVFPLNDHELTYLLLDRPPDVCSGGNKYSTRASRAVHVPRTSTSRDVDDVLLYQQDDGSVLDSPPQSPSSSSASTATPGGDDDKEWTIKPVAASRQSSLILKIAKR